jgi:hypothetical protein
MVPLDNHHHHHHHHHHYNTDLRIRSDRTVPLDKHHHRRHHHYYTDLRIRPVHQQIHLRHRRRRRLDPIFRQIRLEFSFCSSSFVLQAASYINRKSVAIVAINDKREREREGGEGGGGVHGQM